jgi:hypothetical protein
VIKITNSKCVAVALLFAITLLALTEYSVIWEPFWEFSFGENIPNILGEIRKSV